MGSGQHCSQEKSVHVHAWLSSIDDEVFLFKDAPIRCLVSGPVLALNSWSESHQIRHDFRADSDRSGFSTDK